ncbi:DDE-type integrase/transposase/recombinase [Roseimarinus sediminis]|uniref:DDE-type integrase/transposase/recombinase n=1 Tax=Roseimarinus sediminis TaxID=1610899 RepID=UPI003D195F61
MKRDTALSNAGITKHQYYYRPTGKTRGRKASDVTYKIDGDNVDKVPNSNVVESIKEIQEDPDTDYGYRKMTVALMIIGYVINHKKVYRLMKENQLLKDLAKKAQRTFVKYRKVLPRGPLQVIEMDIKYVWVNQYSRYAFVLTIIDTFTRVVLAWKVAYQIKQALVKQIWEKVINNYLQPYDCLNRNIQIEIRNDNDSRFIAKSVQAFFAENQLNQVFTHPYTPQENGHIESFHAILSQKLKRYNFWSLEDLEQTLVLFYEKYNNHRLHSSVLNLPPMVFWDCWNKKLIKTEINEEKRTMKHFLKIPYHKLSGNMSLRAVPCSQPKTLDGFEDEEKTEMIGAETFHQPSV